MLTLDLAAHAAWSPTLELSQPACSDIPAMMRRRFSMMARLCIETGGKVLAEAGIPASEPALVLASRHGEIDVLHRILGQILSREPVSPTHFGNSVHHTALGYFSLAHANRHPARAVSAGERTWEAGWLEAFCLAQAHPELPILLLFAEDVFPDLLGIEGFTGAQARGEAFLLLPAGHRSERLARLRLEPHREGEAFSSERVASWTADAQRHSSLFALAPGASVRFDPVYPKPSELVPHKDPMVLIDEILSFDALHAATRVSIAPGCPFWRPEGVSALAGIEYLAQTVAALSGWGGRREGKDPRIGFLLSVREYRCEVPTFVAGSELRIEVTHEWGDAEMMRFEGRILEAATGTLLACGILNVYGPEDAGQFLETA